MSQIANRLVSVTASSSIIEREFSRVSAVVTKVRNRMSARSVLHFLQLKEHQDFAEGVAEKFQELGLHYQGEERDIVSQLILYKRNANPSRSQPISVKSYTNSWSNSINIRTSVD